MEAAEHSEVWHRVAMKMRDLRNGTVCPDAITLHTGLSYFALAISDAYREHASTEEAGGNSDTVKDGA